VDAAINWTRTVQSQHEPGEYVTATLTGGGLLIR
jgi:hypothetical protein